MLVLLRTFAFLLIDTTHDTSSTQAKYRDQRIRNFRTGLKTCRLCLDKGALDLSLVALERCAEHVRATEEASPIVRITDRDHESDDSTALLALVLEFYLLRMTQAWKSDRLDLAEHFFNKIQVDQLAASTNLSDRAADVLYDIGKSLAKKKHLETAIKWLERAINALNACDVEQSSQDAGELRLAIAACLSEYTKMR